MTEQKGKDKINYLKLGITMIIAGVVGFFISYLIFGNCEGSTLTLTEIFSGDLDRITHSRADSMFRKTCLYELDSIKRTIIIGTMLCVIFGGILNMLTQFMKKNKN